MCEGHFLFNAGSRRLELEILVKTLERTVVLAEKELYAIIKFLPLLATHMPTCLLMCISIF